MWLWIERKIIVLSTPRVKKNYYANNEQPKNMFSLEKLALFIFFYLGYVA